MTRRPNVAVDVAVAIPARDEEEGIEACLSSVLVAVQAARHAGLVARVRVAVAAHRCSDATAARARRILARHPGVDAEVHEDVSAGTVGEVRHALIEAATASWSERHRRAWVFSTDADSIVPTDWITAVLRQAADADMAAVVGLVMVHDWCAGPAARAEYEHIIAAGTHPEGHDHVYGANFAVALRAYRAVGGFPSVPVGEDAALLRRLRLGGWPVLTATTPVVGTSGRMPGRAAHGLGALLQDLADTTPRSPRHTGLTGLMPSGSASATV